MTVLLRWTVRVHKWLALIVGIQIVLWIAGGAVMSILPIERVRGEHNIAEPAPIHLDPSAMISTQEAVDAASLDAEIVELRVQAWQDQPVYNVIAADGASALVDAVTGERLTPISEKTAIDIAVADYAGDPDLAAVEYFEDPTWEYRRTGPAWRVSFADGQGTRIYVSPGTGLVMARRNDTWRLFDFFWMFHIMDYEERENFNNPLLITASVFGLMTVLAGLLLLVLRMQRLVRMELAKRRIPASA